MTLPIQNLDDNDRFIIAGAINLYIESRRRIDGRSLIGVEDVDPLFGIAESLITRRPLHRLPERASEEPSEEEKLAVETATEVVTERLGRRA